MKKSLVTCALFLFLLASCSKDGATGPAGPQGPTGPSGSTGTMNASVFNYTFAPTDFVAYGTQGQPSYRYSSTISIDSITQAVYDNGMVLVYYQGFGTTPLPWYPVPQTIYEPTYSYLMTFYYLPGSLTFQQYPSDMTSPQATFDISIKVVVVPGTTNKTSINIDWKDYNAVKKYFNLKN
jgi:hypothetical protein